MIQTSLSALGNSLLLRQANPNIDSREIALLAQKTIVLLTAGGEGSRLESVTERDQVHKTVLRLHNGDSLIERTIKMYRDAGFARFAVLVFYRASSIQSLLGDGSQLGV